MHDLTTVGNLYSSSYHVFVTTTKEGFASGGNLVALFISDHSGIYRHTVTRTNVDGERFIRNLGIFYSATDGYIPVTEVTILAFDRTEEFNAAVFGKVAPVA